MMSECFGTDDDLDVSDDNTLEDVKDTVRKKKRRRSGSLTGENGEKRRRIFYKYNCQQNIPQV